MAHSSKCSELYTFLGICIILYICKVRETPPSNAPNLHARSLRAYAGVPGFEIHSFDIQRRPLEPGEGRMGGRELGDSELQTGASTFSKTRAVDQVFGVPAALFNESITP